MNSLKRRATNFKLNYIKINNNIHLKLLCLSGGKLFVCSGNPNCSFLGEIFTLFHYIYVHKQRKRGHHHLGFVFLEQI